MFLVGSNGVKTPYFGVFWIFFTNFQSFSFFKVKNPWVIMISGSKSVFSCLFGHSQKISGRKTCFDVFAVKIEWFLTVGKIMMTKYMTEIIYNSPR